MKKMITICMIAIITTLAANALEAPANAQGRDNSVTSHTDVVRANTTDIYRMYFTRGIEAEVVVIGDGDTDLDVYVYDENDNLMDFDIDYGDDCYVSWTPKRSGYFTVKVKNLGDISNRYLLIRN